MTQEDYVSFEIAKLLKEKRFNEACYKRYAPTHNGYILTDDAGHSNFGLSYDNYSAPTIQMAMKWLREIHHYYIQVMLDSWASGGHLGYYVVIQKTDSDFEMMLHDAVDEVFYQTYEEACEAAIKYCLENLI
jgi:hypothetical protein